MAKLLPNTTVGVTTSIGGATNPILSMLGSDNNYIQSYIYNSSNTANASADIVAYPSNGVDSSGWIDMGITSNAYSQAAYSVTGRNEGYVFMSAPAGSATSGNLIIATDSTGLYNSIEFYTAGFTATKGTAGVTIKNLVNGTSNTNATLTVGGGFGVTGNVWLGANGITFADGTKMTTAAAGGSSVGTYNVLFGDGVSKVYTITHNLNKYNVISTVREVASGNVAYPSIKITSNNAMNVTFVTAPSANFYNISIVGF